MSTPDWPSPEQQQRPLPLPRVDDLPVAEQGYDREAVREAFDAFYRHAAQLDATLRTLEAVDVFQRTASELRAELRTVRAAGWTVGGYQRGGYGARSAVREWSLPPAFPRVAAEAVFLIVIGVIVGIAGWSRIAIVLVMALALGIVWLVEWVASRERAIPQAAALPAPPPRLDEEPAELPPADAAGWSAFSEQSEEGPEAMTMISAEPAVPVAESEDEEPDEEEQLGPEVPPEVQVPVSPIVTPGGAPPIPAPVPPPPDNQAEPVAVEEPVPVVEPPHEDPVPVDEPAEEDEVAREELVAQSHKLPGIVPPAVEEISVEVSEEPVRRRFRLWGRPAAAADEPVVETASEREPEPQREEELVLQEHKLEPERVDPWEREAELPTVDAEVEAEVPAVHEERAVRRFGWFRRRPQEVVAVVGAEIDTGELEPELEPQRELAPELLEAVAEPAQAEEPEKAEEPEEPEEPEELVALEPRELPVEVVAEQAEAALARSRARRRRDPRRARRR